MSRTVALDDHMWGQGWALTLLVIAAPLAAVPLAANVQNTELANASAAITCFSGSNLNA
jgi:hypothetical protein